MNQSHAKEMVISVTLNILYLYRRLSCQPMASKQIPDESRIAYSCKSYHFVTWQEALDIIIYLYRVIPRVTNLFPFVRLLSSLSLPVFTHLILFCLCRKSIRTYYSPSSQQT